MARVLVVTPWFPTLHRPGSGAFMLRDVELLSRSHRVTVLHLAERRDLDSTEPMRLNMAGVEVLRQIYTPLSAASVCRAACTIRRLTRRSDAVHSMAFHALLPVTVAHPDISWIHTEHWSGLMQARLPFKKHLGLKCLAPALSRPDAVVAVSQALADSIHQRCGREVVVIPNHVVLGSLSPLAPELVEEPRPLRLVAIGNLIEHKGPMVAVDTLKELGDLGIRASLTWVGAGPLLPSVSRHVHDLGLDQAVSLLGQVAPDRIPGILRHSDLFLLPTRSETFGVAFAEALGQGLPVVATGYGGHLEFLPPEASRVVEERNGRALAQAVASLMRDEERWSARRIMEYAHGRFSERRRKSSYDAIYECLLYRNR